MAETGKAKRHPLPVVSEKPQDWGLEVFITLIRVNSRLEREMTELVGAHGMTLPQFDVLATLKRGEGITQQELAGRLLVSKGNVVGLIDRLCAAGLVERRSDPSDRRANLLYLTDQGRKRFSEALPSTASHRKKLFKSFSEDELKQMHEYLSRLESFFE